MTTDLRFRAPLYTLAEAARSLDVPKATFRNWARGYSHPSSRLGAQTLPTVTDLGAPSGEATVPFIGLAEGFVLAAIRRQGVPLQRIRPAIAALNRELGIEHALASRRLYTDGAEVLFDYAQSTGDETVKELVVARHGQRVFAPVVDAYLKRVTFAADGFAARLRLPQYAVADVIVDPRFSFGQPTFVRGRARVADALSRFWSGESLAEVSAEFGVPQPEMEDAVRIASRWAA